MRTREVSGDVLCSAAIAKVLFTFTFVLFCAEGVLACPGSRAEFDFDTKTCYDLEASKGCQFVECLLGVITDCSDEETWFEDFESLVGSLTNNSDFDLISSVTAQRDYMCVLDARDRTCPASQADFNVETKKCADLFGAKTCKYAQCALDVLSNCAGVAWFESFQDNIGQLPGQSGFDWIAASESGVNDSCKCPVNRGAFDKKFAECINLATTNQQMVGNTQMPACVLFQVLNPCLFESISDCDGVDWFNEFLRDTEQLNSKAEYIQARQTEEDAACAVGK